MIYEFRVGQKVVVTTGKSTVEPYTIGTVEKVTATQITINGNRYLRSSGRLFGYANSFGGGSSAIAMDYHDGPTKLVTVENAEAANLAWHKKNDQWVLAHKILATPLVFMRALPLEVLQEIEKLIERGTLQKFNELIDGEGKK